MSAVLSSVDFLVSQALNLHLFFFIKLSLLLPLFMI
nr:MAG TPA: hypothetical protein [Caudoviricetes sp.]